MIIRKFRDKSIRKKIDKEVLSSNKPSSSFSDEKINSILVFTDENTKASDKIIAKELNVDISAIRMIAYVSKTTKELDSDKFLTENNFNWFGKIKNEYIQDLVNSEFDLLINLSTNNLLLDYLTVTSKARFKVGFSSADNRLYDFMITVDNKDLTVFSRELKKYLEILSKL